MELPHYGALFILPPHDEMRRWMDGSGVPDHSIGIYVKRKRRGSFNVRQVSLHLHFAFGIRRTTLNIRISFLMTGVDILREEQHEAFIARIIHE